jgi:hypothetical protein
MHYSPQISKTVSPITLEDKIRVLHKRKIKFQHLGCEDAELYGSGQYLRKLGFYPQSLPICCMTQHGVSLWDEPQNYQLETNLPYMLASSKRMEDAWKKLSKKPCFTVKNPFVLASKPLTPNRQGTLFFFSHSTKEIDSELDIASLNEILKSLPSHFHPITICLHFRDIEKGIHINFQKLGWNCDTAGHWENPHFAKNFYTLLGRHKFAMSNSIGSYTFYAVHAGIAFSLLGPKPIYNNRCDPSLPLGIASNTFFESQRTHQFASQLFCGLHTETQKSQMDFANQELGILSSISRLKLSYLLYSSFAKQLIR